MSIPPATLGDLTPDIDSRKAQDPVEALLKRFVCYPSEYDRVAQSLWIAHKRIIDVFASTPRLALLSAEPASGKTRKTSPHKTQDPMAEVRP
jgi:hypothetical protein